MKNDLIELLKEELKILKDAGQVLAYSYENCKKIGIKENYSHEELEKFESLTSRFARLSDILIQKVFRLIDEIDLETQGTVRDRINRAEGKELISKASDFIEIRVLRNDIAHDYLPEEVMNIFKNVLVWTPCLLESIEKVTRYCFKYDV